MSEGLKICAAALVAAVCFFLVKRVNGGFDLPLKISAAVVFVGALLALAVPVFSYFSELVGNSELGEWQGIIFSAIGIAALSHLTAELCRDFGENSLAGFAELAGKLEILALCLPLVRAVLEEVEAIVG